MTAEVYTDRYRAEHVSPYRVKYRCRMAVTPDDVERIIKLRKAGLTFAAIVDEVGYSQMTIRRVCIKAGIDVNRGRMPNGKTCCRECKTIFKSADDYSRRSAFCSNDCRNVFNRRYSHTTGQRFKRYGIDREQYREMFEAQEGCCAMCGDEASTDEGLHVDRDHETGEVRGLLCNRCNTALGLVGDTIDGARQFYRMVRSYLS